jgi:hypothetical protein
LLIHVPIVTLPSADGVRATDPEFQRAVDERLERELETRGLPVHKLDPAERQHWLDVAERLVWQRVQPRQLALL